EARPIPRRLSDLLADGRKLVSLSEWPPLAERFRELTGRYLRTRKLLAPVLDRWHQFRVLTARYLELIAGDRRGLRLLLLQAPVVALFLLVGFIPKDFQERVSAADALVGPDGQLTPEARALLEDLRGRVELGGKSVAVSG